MVQKSGEPVEVGSLSHYLQVFCFFPGGAGFQPSTVRTVFFVLRALVVGKTRIVRCPFIWRTELLLNASPQKNTRQDMVFTCCSSQLSTVKNVMMHSQCIVDNVSVSFDSYMSLFSQGIDSI